MFKIRLATANNRQQIIASEDTTPRELLDEYNIITEGASVNLDGIPLVREEYDQPLGELLSSETATLSVVIKTENA